MITRRLLLMVGLLAPATANALLLGHAGGSVFFLTDDTGAFLLTADDGTTLLMPA